MRMNTMRLWIDRNLRSDGMRRQAGFPPLPLWAQGHLDRTDDLERRVAELEARLEDCLKANEAKDRAP